MANKELIDRGEREKGGDNFGKSIKIARDWKNPQW